MTNLRLKKQHGAATLLITTLLMVSITMIVIFAANYSTFQQKISANVNRNQQAYEAAEAGLEFGINYLKENRTTILATASGGYIQPFSNSSVTNVVLANNSRYSITFTNPTANDYTIIRVTSTGTSDDGTATRVLTQLVSYGSLLSAPPTNPLTVKGNVALGGGSSISNTESGTSINSGGTVTISGSSTTTSTSGTSTSSSTGSDIQQSNSTLSSMSFDAYFANFFGTTPATVKSNSTYTYTNLGEYSGVLNGKTGVSIWIDQTSGTAKISSSTVIGSPSSPVLLIINGNLKISGSTIVYGLIYVTGTADVDIVGSTLLVGGLVTSSDLTMTGSSSVQYNSSVLTTTQQMMSYYAKIPGSWKDF